MLHVLLLSFILVGISIAQLPSYPGTCPSEADRKILFPETNQFPDGLIKSCGQGNWREVANLNLTDTNQLCPPNWSLQSSPIRQ